MVFVVFSVGLVRVVFVRDDWRLVLYMKSFLSFGFGCVLSALGMSYIGLTVSWFRASLRRQVG